MLINGFVIKSIEGRIMAGVVTFLAVMILVGWIAINEPARMASFEKLHQGRAIERGGELFAANCSTCHGTDGLGIIDRAPALDNPMLFGHNFLNDINSQISQLERQWNDVNKQLEDLNTERNALTAELGNVETPPTAERQAEIAARLLEINALINPDATADVATLTFEQDELALEQTTLTTEQADAATTDARKEEIAARLEAITARLAEIQTQYDPELYTAIPAKVMVFQRLLTPLYAERNAQILALDPAILKGYLPQLTTFVSAADAGGITEKIALTVYIDQDADRLAQVGWGGDLASYIRTTLIHGRPGSNDVWAQPMVAWSQLGGGPMRSDQIDDITSYILNWDKGDAWTLEDLYAVNQFAKLHGGDTGGDGEDPISTTIPGMDTDAATTAVTALTGDAVRGEAIYNGQERTQVTRLLGCSSCHLGGSQAPATEETWQNVLNIRLSEAQFAGWTPEKYLVFSILHPNDYVVPGFASGLMPQNLGDLVTAQDLADIIAYLKTYAEAS